MANVPIITEEIRLFWNTCIENFEMEAANIIIGFGPKIIDYTDGPKTVEHVRWKGPLDDFVGAYEEIIYGMPEETEKALNKLFMPLYFRLRKEFGADEKDPYNSDSVLNGIKFEFLPKMLDLENSAICKLLPYLLTAYTFNFKESRFFDEGKVLSNIIFDSQNIHIDSAQACKLRDRIKHLSKIFGFSERKNQPLPLPEVKHDGPVPIDAALIKLPPDEIKIPLVRYRDILDEIFNCWCRAIVDSAIETKTEDLFHDLDYELCKRLYDLHLNENESAK